MVALLAGCVSSLLIPSSVTFTAQQMQAALDRQFPLERNYFSMVDLVLTHPIVDLHPEQRRIALQFDATVTILGYDQVPSGHVQVSSGLDYNAADKTIVLKNPQLESQQIKGVSASIDKVLNQLSSVAIREKLEGAVVYRFTPDDLKILGTQVEPQSIQITEQGVVIHIAK